MRILNKLKKVFIVIAACLLVVLLVIGVLYRFFLSSYLEKQIESTVAKFTRGKYNIRFETFEYELTTGDCFLTEVQLIPDSSVIRKNNENQVIELTVKNIVIEHLDIIRLLREKEVTIDEVRIENPDLQYTELQHPVFISEQDKPAKPDTLTVKQKKIQSFHINSIQLFGGKFSAFSNEDDSSNVFVREINFSCNNFDYITGQTDTINPPFSIDGFTLDIKQCAANLPDSINRLTIAKISAVSADSGISVDSVRIKPRYRRTSMASILGYQKEWISVAVEHIDIQKFNFDSLLFRKVMNIEKVAVEKPVFNIYKDKQYPMNREKFPELPQEIIKKIGFSYKIDTVQVTKGFAVYKEKNKEPDSDAKFFMNSINVRLLNITNNPADKGFGTSAKMDASAYIMGKGLLKAHADFPLDDKFSKHTISGTLCEMDLAEFNPLVQHSKKIEITSGRLKVLYFHITLNKSYSRGIVKMEYEDFKLTLLPVDDKAFKYRTLTALANRSVLKKDNPLRRKPLRIGKVYYRRDKNKSFVEYWVKSILTGVLKSVAPKMPKSVKRKIRI